jgi:hypothetical protein
MPQGDHPRGCDGPTTSTSTRRIQIASGAVLAGALICMWPSMVVGSLGGIVAAPKRRFAPVARRIPRKMALGGIVFPPFAFALTVWGYVEFMCWWMSG